jgi:hypothetical protein
MPYDHLLPPEKPRGSQANKPCDLECYPSPVEGIREALPAAVMTAIAFSEASVSLSFLTVAFNSTRVV